MIFYNVASWRNYMDENRPYKMFNLFSSFIYLFMLLGGRGGWRKRWGGGWTNAELFILWVQDDLTLRFIVIDAMFFHLEECNVWVDKFKIKKRCKLCYNDHDGYLLINIVAIINVWEVCAYLWILLTSPTSLSSSLLGHFFKFNG